MTDRSVPITLDRVRHLRFTPNDVVDIEEVLGAGFLTFFQQFEIRILRAMLWGGLKWEDKALTLTGAGDLMQAYIGQGKPIMDLYNKCAEAVISAGWMTKSEDFSKNL